MRSGLLFILLILSACDAPPPKEGKSYEDIKEFFEAEARRLSRTNPEINKTVARNESSETRSVRDINWKTELSLFAESDINKPAWQDSYQKVAKGNTVSYRATDTTLRTREIQISKDPAGRILKINIRNQTRNMLYSSSEQLLYIPDSVYQISKDQRVVVVGDNHYLLKGLFSKK
ncbi:hypothetical protein GZH53_07665 [Flavihumibacter sp. R14]|nr:hypothetical protein [Flavihumibacter soli]